MFEEVDGHADSERTKGRTRPRRKWHPHLATERWEHTHDAADGSTFPMRTDREPVTIN